jgi:hypothetical protein
MGIGSVDVAAGKELAKLLEKVFMFDMHAHGEVWGFSVTSKATLSGEKAKKKAFFKLIHVSLNILT